MSRLLMIESWVNATGLILPRKIRELGHRYVLLTRDADMYSRSSPEADGHPALLCAESVVEVETNDLSALLSRVDELHAREPFSGVLTTCDYYLPAVALAARQLGLPGLSPQAMHVAVKKHLVREACRRAGIPGPAFRCVENASDAVRFAREVGFPLVVKPVDLCASEKVSAVHDEVELVRAFERVTSEPTNSRAQLRPRLALIESFVDGPELCVETLSQGGRTTILGISGKTLSAPPLFLELGSHVPADISSEEVERVSEYVKSVLAAMGYSRGLGHVEVRLTADGPYLIEVNPRMGGDYLSELYQHTSGIDIAALDVDLALGKPLDLGGKVPKARGSAALECLLPPRGGHISRVEGADELAADPRYPRVTVKAVAGKTVPEPADNSAFIGFVVAVDPEGNGARQLARAGIERLRVIME